MIYSHLENRLSKNLILDNLKQKLWDIKISYSLIRKISHYFLFKNFHNIKFMVYIELLTQWLTILQFNKSNNNFFIAKSLGNKKAVTIDNLS